jgi:hypothetical protein
MHIARYPENPEPLYLPFSSCDLGRWMGDVGNMSCVYEPTFGRRLDFGNAEFFAEMLNWLKFHERMLAIHAERGEGGTTRHRGLTRVTPSLGSKLGAASAASTSMRYRTVSSSDACTNQAASWSATGRSALTAGTRSKRSCACLKRHRFNRLGVRLYEEMKPCVFAEEHARCCAKPGLAECNATCINGKVRLPDDFPGREVVQVEEWGVSQPQARRIDHGDLTRTREVARHLLDRRGDARLGAAPRCTFWSGDV